MPNDKTIRNFLSLIEIHLFVSSCLSGNYFVAFKLKRRTI